MLKIAIVRGSTRPGRNNEAVANWVYRIAKERKAAEFELVDIASFNLPLLDEPLPPLFSQYSREHTKAWSIVGGGQLPPHARIPDRSGSGVYGARVS
jgi:NAD(P)H-dependent FMN reductase